MIMMNKIGIKNDANDPSNIASPKRIRFIPKYIGCLLNANGPEIINVDGIPSGLTVVLLRLKYMSVHKLNMTPISKGIKPIRFKGNVKRFSVGSINQRIIFEIASV